MKKTLSFLNIEYGSISFSKILKSFFLSFIFSFSNSNKLEDKLRQIVKKKLKKNIYFLKNARSSLGFFLKSQGIKKNDEVILSSFTCLAVPYGILSCGAKPVYLDIDKRSLNFNLKNLKKKINNNVKAVVVQHTLGKSADIQNIKKFLKKKNILLIEDCALSIGSRYKNKILGTFGDASIFSMELSKTISSGWGGILLVNNKFLVEKVKKEYSFIKRENSFKSFLKHVQIFLSVICYNKSLYFFGKFFYSLFYKIKLFKPSSSPDEVKAKFNHNFFEKLGRFQIIFAIIQWNIFDQIILKCLNNYKKLNKCIKNLNIKTLPKANQNETLVSNRICFLVDNRKKFENFFNINGVAVGKWFDGPLSPNPRSKLFNYNKKEFKFAKDISKKIVNLPCNSSLSDFDCQHIIILLNKYFSKKNNVK